MDERINYMRYLFATLILFMIPLTLWSQDVSKDLTLDEEKQNNEELLSPTRTYYYFKNRDAGASAFYNPPNIMIQGAIGALRNRSIVEFDFVNGADRLFSRIGHPIDMVSDYGWENFLWDEFIPNVGRGQSYFPNYLWHLVGGGMRYKLMEEYYYFHGYEYPKIYAWISVYTFHIVNEIVQTEDQRNSVDAIADLFFFDFIANFLFEIDVFNRFMNRTLHFREWSYQTQINLLTGRQGANWGQLYWARIHIWGPFSIAALSGEQVMFTLGPSYEFDSGYQLSLGMGPQTRNFFTDDSGTIDTEKLSLSFGIYLSKDDDPIVAIYYEPELDPATSDVPAIPNENMAGDPLRANEFSHKLVINLFPGVISIGEMNIGLTLQYYKDAFYLGVSSGDWPVGFIAGTPISDRYKNVY